MYVIQAVRQKYVNPRKGFTGGTRTTQVPTFYLDPNVQGIISRAHAERVAREILGELPDQILHIQVEKV